MSFEVSQSKVKTWRHCKKAYDYKYIQKLTKKFKPMPFLRGDIVHQMLEAHYLKKDPWPIFNKLIKDNEKPLRIYQEEYGDLAGNLKNLMTGYFSRYKKEDLKPIEVEHEFRVKLVGNIYVVGKIDLIARSQGMKWLGEHKCHNNIPTSSITPVANIQSPMYLWSYMKETGKKLDGVLWNYLLGRPLPVPQILKSGEMSRKKTSTTWPIYRAALKEAGLDPKDYLDMKEQLAGNEELIYQRKHIPTNKTIIENVVEDFKHTAQEIQKLGGKDTTRNLSWDCDRCEFKTLCTAQLQGLDYNFILKSDFKKREKDGHEKHIEKD
jgi:hypothetical protein